MGFLLLPIWVWGSPYHPFGPPELRYNNKQDGGRAKMSSDWSILTKLRCKLQRGCYTQATCLETLRKVEGRSTFLANRNATIAFANWGVAREFLLAICNATFLALQIARKIVSCHIALRKCQNKFECLIFDFFFIQELKPTLISAVQFAPNYFF